MITKLLLVALKAQQEVGAGTARLDSLTVSLTFTTKIDVHGLQNAFRRIYESIKHDKILFS